MSAPAAPKLKCPRCGADLHRSRAKGLPEKFLRRVLRLRKYRCEGCGHRQWRWRSAGDAIEPAPAPAKPVEPRRHRTDPLARIVRHRRWRKVAVTIALVLAGGLALGMVVARGQSSSAAESAE